MKILALDFDGTVVKHRWPLIGDSLGAEIYLRMFIEDGWQIVLWTVRSGEELQAAIKWFDEREIPLYAINENPTQKTWSSSPKCHAHLYIDDTAIGAPIEYDELGARCIHWGRVWAEYRERRESLIG